MSTMYDFQRLLSTGLVGASFTSHTMKTTRPVSATGQHVIEVGSGGGNPTFIEIVPIVGDTTNETMLLRVWIWNKTVPFGTTVYWVPRLLAHVTATASTTAVPAGVDAAATPKVCDIVAMTYGDANANTTHLISPGTGTEQVGHFRVNIRGAELVQVDFDVGTGDTANALWRFVDE